MMAPTIPPEPWEVDRLTRGRDLTEREIAEYLASRQTALRHATADVGTEIAEKLRDRLAETPPGPLDALRALSDAATPGPWRVGDDGWGVVGADEDPRHTLRIADDSAFIVAAVNYVRAALTPASPSHGEAEVSDWGEPYDDDRHPASPSDPPGLDAKP